MNTFIIPVQHLLGPMTFYGAWKINEDHDPFLRAFALSLMNEPTLQCFTPHFYWCLPLQCVMGVVRGRGWGGGRTMLTTPCSDGWKQWLFPWGPSSPHLLSPSYRGQLSLSLSVPKGGCFTAVLSMHEKTSSCKCSPFPSLGRSPATCVVHYPTGCTMQQAEAR